MAGVVIQTLCRVTFFPALQLHAERKVVLQTFKGNNTCALQIESMI